MGRSARAAGLGLSLALVTTLVLGPSAQASPTLDQARTQAAKLRHQLAALQVQQSVAIERYDGIQDELQQAVSTELTTSDQATNVAAQAQAGARPARDAAIARAGADLALARNVALYAQFDGDIAGGGGNAYAGSGGIRISW